MNFHSFFELDVELTVVISAQNPYYKGFCFFLVVKPGNEAKA